MLQPRLPGFRRKMGCERNCTRWSLVCVAVILSTTLVTCQDANDSNEPIEATRIKREGVPENRAFNTNGIIYDNSPWRPGRDAFIRESEEDERKLKNLATKVMSNGVEVLIKDKNSDGKQEQTKYMDIKTIKPSVPTNMYASNFPKIDKRIDNEDEDGFDLIQPSELGHIPCTTSCSCSHTKTEGLKTKYTNIEASAPLKYAHKTSKYSASKLDLKPTNVEIIDKKTQYGPYEFETSAHTTPTDKIVEKYTEVINDYSDEKDSHVIKDSELLTNEQAPLPLKNKLSNSKHPDKTRPEKPQKPNKNKFVVADLLKLGSLGIKGLSQLAPVIEKMTGGFIKRQETINKTTTTSTTNPPTRLTAYNVNKRVDTDLELKPNNFPIYIPVDELETSESQIVFTNATLHQNLAWAAEHKQLPPYIVPPKIVHESPLVNGGIPISPGEIITANSDVIVGKPAVGGPLPLVASGIKFHNPVSPPKNIDSLVAGNEQYIVEDKPLMDQSLLTSKVDDSFDLRPPEVPKIKHKQPNWGHGDRIHNHNFLPSNKAQNRYPTVVNIPNDHLMKTEHLKNTQTILGNHGRPAFLDYIPSLLKPTQPALKHHNDFIALNEDTNIPDNNPSSSEIVHTRVKTNNNYDGAGNKDSSKQFLVDIQPSRVANILIPHGSSTALVFAGSSEPHKTGDYIDDPLPYPQPGYFGSFSIDAPQMTNVHNVPPNNKPFVISPSIIPMQDTYNPLQQTPKDYPYRTDLKLKWKDSKHTNDYKIPPPTSNQETFVQVGPKITAYNPDVFNPNNGDFDKYNHVRTNELKNSKGIIDKEYENYLAVPPPPPKMTLHSEIARDKNKMHIPHPIVHTKPIQDMKVFLNIQHPIPNTSKHESVPPKVTSEIYFAAQAPNSRPTPTYTIHIPPASPSPMYPHHFLSNVQSSTSASHVYNPHSKLATAFSTKNKSLHHNEIIEKENTYTVTLNTATSVANKGDEVGQVIGSSVSVPISVSSKDVPLNSNIPIKTNFAIRVEDTPSIIENQVLHHIDNFSNVYKEYIDIGANVSKKNTQWNKNTNDLKQPQQQSTVFLQNIKPNEQNEVSTTYSSAKPSINSHANFPMMNELAPPTNVFDNIKPVTEYQDEDKVTISPRPAKHIPNIPTNSHGWYSSVLVNEHSLNKINVESTTRRIIPLSQEYNSKVVLEFGEKLSGIGKPPSETWHENSARKPEYVSFSIGKPFTKPNFDNIHKPVPETYNEANYIPSNFGSIKQPVYDIPIKDNIPDTTTDRPKSVPEKLKPVYENSEEIYDGEDIPENSGELDGEVSLESMKIPVVSSSIEFDTQKPSSTELTLLQEEIFEPPKPTKDENIVKFEFNSGTQTEKPFTVYNKSSGFTNNVIKPIVTENSHQYSQKPRPFTITAVTLDHQLQQPHWQINQLMENSTNMSYEENLELNIGEEMSTIISSTKRPQSTPRIPPFRHTGSDVKYKRPVRPVFSHPKNVSIHNDSNIITSTVHIQDKTPFIIEKNRYKSTMRPYLLTNNFNSNRTSTEIIDLSPPPPTLDYNFKPSPNDEMIMGMSPPPPRTPSVIRPQSRPSMTPRPVVPIRTPAPYRTKPSRTPPPKMLITQRPIRKPINRDEASTYRPTFELPSNVRRPTYNKDQPSSQLLPPVEIPSQINEEILSTEKFDIPPNTNVVFPTPISSGWITSSGIDFSSSFNFGPSSIQFPEDIQPSKSVEFITTPSEVTESYDVISSSEHHDTAISEKPVTEDRLSTTLNDITTESITTTTMKSTSHKDTHITDSLDNESRHENNTRDTIKVIHGSYRNRTRLPYPIRNEDKKINSNKIKLPTVVTPIIKPTRTLNRPAISYPTRHLSTRKVIRPIPTRSSSDIISIVPSSVIESSETFIDDSIIKQTEIINESSVDSRVDKTSLDDKVVSNEMTPILGDQLLSVKPTHHAGNEIKISDDVIPTKTEFRTTIVTLTKTLSEPPKTVSSVNYVNVTHTLTVTHTMTSLISQSEGAVTQTLVLTNTHTSTIVDVVTEVQTQVHPTTIIETVTKHIPIPQVEASTVKEISLKTKSPLDDISMSYEENDKVELQNKGTTENIQKIDTDSESDNDTFFVVMNKSQNGGQSPPVNTDIDTGDYDGVTRNEEVNSNGVSQVLFGEILLAGTPYLETTNILNSPGVTYSKECHPDCKASRNERCQRIDGIMKCVCRPGFARMFPDRPCKPTYTYSVELALGSQGNKRLEFHENLSDNSSKQYHELAVATHEGINRMVMQSDLRDVYHGVHITGFKPLEMNSDKEKRYQGVMNEFYVQLSDNAHESRLKEVIEKYLRNNNYSLGGTDVHAAADFVHKLDVTDFNECLSSQFHDCSEHAKCYNLNGTYTCSCLEGYADLSVNKLYPGRICSTEPVGCERCNYHGACYTRDDRRVLCECFQWYSGSSCQINLKVVLISLVVAGALLSVVLAVCAILACSRPRKQPRSIVACIQSMPSIHQAAMPSKQRADRRALISERGESGDASSVQNASLPYIPSKQRGVLKSSISAPPTHEAPVPPPPAVLIPRARLHPLHGDSRENISKKLSLELSSEAKLISYLESGAVCNNDEMRRKHSMESSYSANKDRHNKQGALVSAGFKVSTTIRPDEMIRDDRDDRDDVSSAHKGDIDDLTRFGSLRKSYSTLSEARSIGGTLPASTGRAASSTRLTHQEANTMAERDLGSTFLLPHVHLYKPDLTSDVSEFDSL
ncbi:hypothetical protein ACJJTC_007600 [Scirpophaga incertulas]